MGWFKDLTGVSSRDALGMSALGIPFDPTTAAVVNQIGQEFETEKDPGTMELNKGVMQGVQSLSDIAYDAQGNLIIPQYRAPGQLSQTALGRMVSMAESDPLGGLAEQYYTDVLGGSENPYLDRMYERAAGKVRSGLSSQFEKAGRYGGTDMALAMGESLGNLATDVYGGAYESDMARRERAARIAPSATMENLQRQYAVGQLQDAVGREASDWEYEQGMDAVNRYLSTLGVAKGSYSPRAPRNRGMEALSILTSLGQLAAIPMTGGASAAVPNPFGRMTGQSWTDYGGYS